MQLLLFKKLFDKCENGCGNFEPSNICCRIIYLFICLLSALLIILILLIIMLLLIYLYIIIDRQYYYHISTTDGYISNIYMKNIIYSYSEILLMDKNDLQIAYEKGGEWCSTGLVLNDVNSYIMQSKKDGCGGPGVVKYDIDKGGANVKGKLLTNEELKKYNLVIIGNPIIV